jgi:hypothetical protein
VGVDTSKLINTSSYTLFDVQNDMDKYAHLLCSDGTVFNIEKGGKVVCSAATPDTSTGFVVYG